MTANEPTVVAVVVTSGQAVVVVKRADQTPPWTFPGGELELDEDVLLAANRIVMKEASITVAASQQIGRRTHPATGRDIVYVAAATEHEPIRNGDPGDLLEVRWATFAEAKTLMPDMFGKVSDYLDRLS